MYQSIGDLKNERASYEANAKEHNDAANAAQRRAHELSVQISSAKSAIEYARSFKDNSVGTLVQKNKTLSDQLGTLGTSTGAAIGDGVSCSHAKKILAGNQDAFDSIKSQCDQIISRLQFHVDSLQVEHDNQVQEAANERQVSRNYSNMASTVQSAIDNYDYDN